MAMYRTETFQTGLMRISYAFGLFKAREYQNDNGAKTSKFGCTLIAPIADAGVWDELQGRIVEAVQGEWGEKGLDALKSGLIKTPFLAGDGPEARNKETGELHPGMGADVRFIRVQANEDRRPAVVSPNLTPLLKEEDLPSGSWGHAALTAYAWAHDATRRRGVSLGIEAFQLVKKAEGDEILGGSGKRVDPKTFFKPVAGAKKPADASGFFS